QPQGPVPTVAQVQTIAPPNPIPNQPLPNLDPRLLPPDRNPPGDPAVRIDPVTPPRDPPPVADPRIDPRPMPVPNPADPTRDVVLDRQDKLPVPIIPPAPEEVLAPPPAVWTGHTEIIRSVAFSNCGKYALSASGVINRPKGPPPPDNTVRLWDARR